MRMGEGGSEGGGRGNDSRGRVDVEARGDNAMGERGRQRGGWGMPTNRATWTLGGARPSHPGLMPSMTRRGAGSARSGRGVLGRTRARSHAVARGHEIRGGSSWAAGGSTSAVTGLVCKDRLGDSGVCGSAAVVASPVGAPGTGRGWGSRIWCTAAGQPHQPRGTPPPRRRPSIQATSRTPPSPPPTGRRRSGRILSGVAGATGGGPSPGGRRSGAPAHPLGGASQWEGRTSVPGGRPTESWGGGGSTRVDGGPTTWVLFPDPPPPRAAGWSGVADRPSAGGGGKGVFGRRRRSASRTSQWGLVAAYRTTTGECWPFKA